MVSRRLAHLVPLFMFPLIFMLEACGERPGDNTTEDKSQNENATTNHVDWGSEIDLNKMVAMAKEGRINEIQWHVMPNILRAQTADARIFHLKNEDKGVDLRNTLINEGVKIGEGGIQFKHFF